MILRRILTSLLVVLVVVASLVGYHYYSLAQLATGFCAKTMCSAVFVSKRTPVSVVREELAAFDYIATDIDTLKKIVTASIHGLARRKAVFRPGLGATLVIGCKEQDLYRQAEGFQPNIVRPDPSLLWPFGEAVDLQNQIQEVDQVRLAQALDSAFCEPQNGPSRLTRGVVVVYKRKLVAERYAPGFTAQTPQLGWSMTKTVTGLLIGILSGQGKLSVEQRAAISLWQNDSRQTIAIHNLLHMESGLAFNENYATEVSDVTKMLFGVSDAARVAIDKTLESPVGEKFRYSSGTSNILSYIIRDQFKGSLSDYWSFPRQALFNRLAMSSAVIEPDASGILLGASFMYATPRDWARLGLLVLQDGLWQGERVLPAGWIQYMITPSKSASKGQYGAHIWLNLGPPDKPQERPYNRLPQDMISFRGHDGQFVWIIPSSDLVVVRMGYTKNSRAWDQTKFLLAILSAIQPSTK